MKKKIITIVLTIGTVTGAVFVLKGNKEEMQQKTELAKKVNASIPVKVESVTKSQVLDGFTSTGNFEASQELTMVSEGSGKIVSIHVKEGQFVRVGDVLARLESATKSADLKTAEVTFKKLETDKQRYENLFQSGGVSQAQLDDVNINYVNAQSRLVTAQKNLADTYIKAPFSGFINKKYIEIGSYLSAQSNKTFDLVDISKLKMVVNVTEQQVLSVNSANKILVFADVYPNTRYEAKVNFIGAKADANLSYPVELTITNIKDRPLRAGMFGKATFELSSGPSAIVISRDALVGSVNDPKVYAITGDSVSLIKIVVGRQFSNKLEVLEGLEDGQQIVTAGQINLNEGARVNVISTLK